MQEALREQHKQNLEDLHAELQGLKLASEEDLQRDIKAWLRTEIARGTSGCTSPLQKKKQAAAQ